MLYFLIELGIVSFLNQMIVYEDINLAIINHLENKRGLRILDIGCGSGALGEIIKNNGNYVEGVTISEQEAEIARNKLDKVFVFDVESDNYLITNEYDVILFADILEHLRNPWVILERFNQYLKKDGEIIISVPNVATWTIRFSLMLGAFNYSRTGLMDRSHLRFSRLKP